MNPTPLNQPAIQQADPLAPLRDIHLPDPIGWWPLAPGWWVVALIFTIALVLIIRWLIQRHINNRYRKQAIRSLEHCFQHHGSSTELAPELLTLLRRVVLTASPKNSKPDALSQSAESFLLQLNQWVKAPLFDQDSAQLLSTMTYSSTPQPLNQNQQDALMNNCRQWLKKHSWQQLQRQSNVKMEP